MSVQTWLDEYYPYSNGYVPDTWEEAIEVCLVKWDGLRASNVIKHDLAIVGEFIQPFSPLSSEYRISYGSRMCALCTYTDAINSILGENDMGCDICPLSASRGGHSCDSDTEEEEDLDIEAPWFVMVDYKNPEPMIKDLQKTKIFMQEHVFNRETLVWESK